LIRLGGTYRAGSSSHDSDKHGRTGSIAVSMATVSQSNLQPRRVTMAINDEERGVLLSVLAGIGIGVLVGAVAGLLLAPKSGEETRDDLSKSLNDLSDKVSDLGRTVGQKVSSAVDRTRSQMAQKLGEISSDAEESLH
jgi:gas vesicle protein